MPPPSTRREPAPALASIPPFADISDLEAVAQVARGNREMFEVIVRRYNQPLYRVGMAYLRNHSQAEDAMQNAYVKAFLNLGSFQGGAAFSTWLTRIMINECLMTLRRLKHAATHADAHFAADEIQPAAAEPAATERLQRQEMKILLEQAIASLPRNFRAVYMLREVQQLSVVETATCLGISAANVKVLLHRSRERLKSELLRNAAGAELFAYDAVLCDPMTVRVMSAVKEMG